MLKPTRFPNGIEGPLVNTEGVVGSVEDLDQTIADPPTQAEVQAISDKVDELLAALRSAGILE